LTPGSITMRVMLAAQLADYLRSESPVLIDVREPWEFDICHIDNSINIPMGQIPQSLQQFENDSEFVLICHHGVRSMRVIQFLQAQSIENLINLEGGVDAWAREVDPSMPVY
jgi:rhodanese-related sulfurtransferase